jgi:hypothetical protein
MMWGPGMSTSCLAPFQPFWFDAFSPKQVFAYDQQEGAMDSWIKREGINRAMLDGRLPLDDYKAELDAIQSRWNTQADAIQRSDRKLLCDKIAEEAETFFNKWLKISETIPSRPMGALQFQIFWRAQNASLGKNRIIAY